MTELLNWPEEAGGGLGAEGTAGLPPTLGAIPGFAPMGGVGLGLVATGGGGFEANELEGRELAGELLSLAGAFFQGVAEPLAAAMPGKTETGFAEGLAVTAEGVNLAAAGVGTLLRGGGGGAGGAAGCGGTSSK